MSIDLTKMKPSYQEQGIQRQRLPVDDAGAYTGNQTLFMSYAMRDLVLTNDDTGSTLTAVVTGDASYSVTITLLPGDVWDERMYPFNKIVVTTSGNWRYVVKSGLIS